MDQSRRRPGPFGLDAWKHDAGTSVLADESGDDSIACCRIGAGEKTIILDPILDSFSIQRVRTMPISIFRPKPRLPQPFPAPARAGLVPALPSSGYHYDARLHLTPPAIILQGLSDRTTTHCPYATTAAVAVAEPPSLQVPPTSTAGSQVWPRC